MLRDPTGIAYAVAAVIFAWVAALTWRRKADSPTVAVSLVVLMLGLGVSSVADAVAVASTNQLTAAIASLAILPGVGIATGAFICLGIGVVWPEWAPGRGLVALLLVEPLVVTMAAATNPWHLWVYRGAGAAELTGSAAWGYGPGFWWHTGYSYLALLIGIGFIAWGWWHAPPAFRKQRFAILLATFIPCAANVVYLARGFGDLVDPTPFGFAVAGLVIFYAIFRQDLFTFSPVARALIIDQIGDVIVAVSPGGRVLDLNPAAVALFRGMNPGAPSALIGASAEALFGESIATPGAGETEIVLRSATGRTEFQVRASLLIDHHHRGLGTVLVARDVTEANNQSRRLAAAHTQLVRQFETIELLRADLAELASRDALTGLHNRRHLVEIFASMIAEAERTDEPLVVVLFDVDRFKAINDEFGHQAGDAVLVGLAQLMREEVPVDAMVARWGGEEFFAALPRTDAAAGLAFANDLRRRCELNVIVFKGRMIRCTISVGVAAYPASGTSMDDLFHAVDASMYEAKNAGRNLVRLHQSPTTIPVVVTR
ncbi:MAG: diguanylate cyclase [Dermatophilaceae bacterium]